MNTNDFMRAIESSKIAKHKEFIRQVIRPAIDIVKNKEAEPILGCSRFGGVPDLPNGSQWPTHNDIPHRFLGQINFADIPQNDSGLPSSGLLGIFVALDYTEDGDEHIFWNDDGYIRAIFTPTLDDLTPIAPPSGFGIENPCEVVLEFYPTIDIPFDEYQVSIWPFEFDSEESKTYDEMRASLHKGNDYLLGYPSHCSLAYNPAPGMEWISLLTVGSDDDLQWQWHDGDNLMIFVEGEKLKNSDFGMLKSDAG